MHGAPARPRETTELTERTAQRTHTELRMYVRCYYKGCKRPKRPGIGWLVLIAAGAAHRSTLRWAYSRRTLVTVAKCELAMPDARRSTNSIPPSSYLRLALQLG